VSPEPARPCPGPNPIVVALEEATAHLPRYVIHLPLRIADRDRAAALAYWIARSLAFLPEVECENSVIVREDEPRRAYWIFCDRFTPERRRCVLRLAHAGPCTAQPTVGLDQPESSTPFIEVDKC
jgi:hypothetical protein